MGDAGSGQHGPTGMVFGLFKRAHPPPGVQDGDGGGAPGAGSGREGEQPLLSLLKDKGKGRVRDSKKREETAAHVCRWGGGILFTTSEKSNQRPWDGDDKSLSLGAVRANHEQVVNYLR